MSFKVNQSRHYGQSLLMLSYLLRSWKMDKNDLIVMRASFIAGIVLTLILIAGK